jgi:hypothetical protein
VQNVYSLHTKNGFSGVLEREKYVCKKLGRGRARKSVAMGVREGSGRREKRATREREARVFFLKIFS